jgi:hypothetical protein
LLTTGSASENEAFMEQNKFAKNQVILSILSLLEFFSQAKHGLLKCLESPTIASLHHWSVIGLSTSVLDYQLWQ